MTPPSLGNMGGIAMFPAYFPLLVNFLNTLPDIEQQLSVQTLLVNCACHAII